MRKAWTVEVTDVFSDWWRALEEREQENVDAAIMLLAAHGVELGYPHSSSVKGSRHGHLRELRVQSGGRPLRLLYAFEPRRTAILLVGGDKTGDNRFYDRMIRLADGLYEDHLDELRREGRI